MKIKENKKKECGVGEIRTHDRRVSPNTAIMTVNVLKEHTSVLQRFLTDLPRRVDLSRPVVHHLSAGARRHSWLGHNPATLRLHPSNTSHQ